MNSAVHVAPGGRGGAENLVKDVDALVVLEVWGVPGALLDACSALFGTFG